MQTLGRFIAVFARILLRHRWSLLRIELQRLYEEYQRRPRARPAWILQALLISGEDHRFFNHSGVDPIAVCRAILRTATQGKKEGASTIEMQLVRVLTGCYEKSVRRKIREIALATLLTDIVPKRDLPALYLKVGYYGWRMNGLEAACRRLKLQPTSVLPWEAASIIARLKYPQPQDSHSVRAKQIAQRARHLLALHPKHSERLAYRDLPIGENYATF